MLRAILKLAVLRSKFFISFNRYPGASSALQNYNYSIALIAGLSLMELRAFVVKLVIEEPDELFETRFEV